jgi:hypothetical protein
VVLLVFLVPILIGAFLLAMEHLEDELLGAHPAARTTQSPGALGCAQAGFFAGSVSPPSVSSTLVRHGSIQFHPVRRAD